VNKYGSAKKTLQTGTVREQTGAKTEVNGFAPAIDIFKRTSPCRRI